MKLFKKCSSLLSGLNESKSKIKNVAKLVYIAYIRVFIFKFEEYVRNKSTKLKNTKDIINEINNLKSPISSIIELFYYKVIYNKNDKDINIFESEKKLYNIESLKNFNNFFNYQENDNNSDEENEVKDNYFINLLEEKVFKLKNSKEEFPFIEYFYYSDYIDEKYLTAIDEYKKYPVLSEYLELKNHGNILNDFYIYNMALNSLNEEFSTKITRERAKKETLEQQFIYKENKELFNKFIDIFNKYIDENEEEYMNNIKNNLDIKLPLFNFFITDENEFSDKYKYIYKLFIDKHNEIVGKLLEKKSKNFNVQNKKDNKINIEDITKEDDILITKDDFSFQNDLFDNSYRKVILDGNYLEFNNFEINFEYIEEILTEKLLKNKKLISDEILNFKYKDEDLEFENQDICTKFKNNFNEEKLSINDKIIFYNYFEENKGNTNLHLKLLNEFAFLIKYCNENLDRIKEPSQTKITKILEEIGFISNDFKEIFIDKNNLILNKLLRIYDYYQILCFDKIKDQLKQYQEKIIDKNIKTALENFKNNDLSDEKIKNILENALRKFITCFLVQIKENKKKIKQNKNNIKNYLEIEDLWDENFYKNEEFYQLIKKLQVLGIQINNIIYFYEKCFKEMNKNYFDDVKAELKEREEEKKKDEEEKEKEDIRNFNPLDIGVDENLKNLSEIKDEENDDDNIIENNNTKKFEDNEDDDDYLDEGGSED